MFGTQRLGGFEPRCGSYVHHPYTSMKEVWDEVNSMAENGQVFCQYMIGNAYCYGDCIEMLGYDDAYYYLGGLYYDRGDLPKDLPKAKRYYEKGIEVEAREVGCKNALGSMYFYGGDGVEQNYEKALQHTIDVFFLDIILNTGQNGDVSGLEFAQKMRSIEKYRFTLMIFTTSLMDPKLYAFTNIHSYAYLEKPYDPNEVKKIVEKTIEYTTEREEDKNLFFRKDGLIFSVNISEIIYIENSGHRLTLQTKMEKMQMPYKSCKKLMEEIDCKYFMQCSRSTIVNMKYVLALDLVNRYLVLKDGLGSLEIGIAYIKKVKEAFQAKD